MIPLPYGPITDAEISFPILRLVFPPLCSYWPNILEKALVPIVNTDFEYIVVLCLAVPFRCHIWHKRDWSASRTKTLT